MSILQKQIDLTLKYKEPGLQDVLRVLAEGNAQDPGALLDLDDDVYRASVGINQSGFKHLKSSLKKYKYWEIEGNRQESTKSQDLGTMVHAGILEPSKIFDKYHNDLEIVQEVLSERPELKSVRASKDYKMRKAEIEQQGKQIITDDVFTAMNRMVNRVYEHPRAKNILSGGHAEKALYGVDPETGLLLKCKIDYLLNDGYLIDVKTTDDASPDNFMWSNWKWNYFVQAAYYLHIARLNFGPNFKEFLVVCVETSAPYEVAVYRMDEAALMAGEVVFRENLRLIAKAIEEDSWPGYDEGIMSLSLPDKAFNILSEKYDELEQSL